MTKADCNRITLNHRDAAVVKGMLERGDRQHDIAAWFGVNGGRIADISTGKTFQHVAARHNDLPPPGPYSYARERSKMKQAIEDRIDELIGVAERFEERLAELK